MATEKNRINFTQGRIKDLPSPESGRVEYHDIGCPKLTCRVSSTGVKSFVVLKWTGKTTQRVTLGRFPDMSVDEARKRTQSALTTIATGINPTMAAAGTIYGGMGLAALEEQRNMLEQQKASNAITQAEYDNAMAEINRSEADARRAVAESPFNANPNRDVSIGETYYDRAGGEDNLYAKL